MNRAIAHLILLLFTATGCETDPADLLPDSSLELTDGFCLVSGDQVVLNHRGIQYYDYGTHLIYLKNQRSSHEILEAGGELQVYAGGKKIYTATIQPGYSSLMPVGPVIWSHPTFYPDYLLAIDQVNSYGFLTGKVTDLREDDRIVEALEKYDQYRGGLEARITSVWYAPPGELRLNMRLHNRDQVNYYYLDPEKMGMGLYHYFTNGVTLWDTMARESYTSLVEHVQPDPWDGWDLDWMSLLEGGESVNITLEYTSFETVPPGDYQVLFQLPGLQNQVERDQLDQAHGRIWLGKLLLRGEQVVN